MKGHVILLDMQAHRIADSAHHAARTAGAVWNASIVLAKAFERIVDASPHEWEGKCILELGAGTGLMGIAAAHCLPASAHVHITDLEDAMPAIMVRAKRET